MSLAGIKTGIKTVYEGVEGIGTVLMYAPKHIASNYEISTRLTGFESAVSGQVRGVRWFFSSRLVILWQDAEQAELDLATFTERILAAVTADPRLAGALSSGLAEITAGDSDWMTVEGSKNVYLYMDFNLAVLEK